MVGYENLDVKLFLLRVLNLSGVTPESYVLDLEAYCFGSSKIFKELYIRVLLLACVEELKKKISVLGMLL